MHDLKILRDLRVSRGSPMEDRAWTLSSARRPLSGLGGGFRATGSLGPTVAKGATGGAQNGLSSRSERQARAGDHAEPSFESHPTPQTVGQTATATTDGGQAATAKGKHDYSGNHHILLIGRPRSESSIEGPVAGSSSI